MLRRRRRSTWAPRASPSSRPSRTSRSGRRALVYVRSQAELAVTIKPDAEHTRPGKTATLAIRTTAGNRGTRAAVGLFGVDASLAQLAPLPGPDDMAHLRPTPRMRGL